MRSARFAIGRAAGVRGQRYLQESPTHFEGGPSRSIPSKGLLHLPRRRGRPPRGRATHEMTRVIVEIAKQFGIAIQDHIIVGKQGHASLKELELI